MPIELEPLATAPARTRRRRRRSARRRSRGRPTAIGRCRALPTRRWRRRRPAPGRRLAAWAPCSRCRRRATRRHRARDRSGGRRGARARAGSVNAARIDRSSPSVAVVDRMRTIASVRGMERRHVRLDQDPAGGVGGGEQLLGLGRVHAERLLAQHVLAGRERRPSPSGGAGRWAAGCRRCRRRAEPAARRTERRTRRRRGWRRRPARPRSLASMAGRDGVAGDARAATEDAPAQRRHQLSPSPARRRGPSAACSRPCRWGPGRSCRPARGGAAPCRRPASPSRGRPARPASIEAPAAGSTTAVITSPKRSSGTPDAHGVDHAAVGLQHLLDLFGEHLLAAGVDAHRAAAEQVERAVGADLGPVAGHAPAPPSNVRKVWADFTSSL